MKKLKPKEIENALEMLPGWSLNGDLLESERIFPDFVQAMVFVNRLAELAEASGHHPDIDIRYNKVKLGLTTHDSGGITEKDLLMAKAFSDTFQ